MSCTGSEDAAAGDHCSLRVGSLLIFRMCSLAGACRGASSGRPQSGFHAEHIRFQSWQCVWGGGLEDGRSTMDCPLPGFRGLQQFLRSGLLRLQ